VDSAYGGFAAPESGDLLGLRRKDLDHPQRQKSWMPSKVRQFIYQPEVIARFVEQAGTTPPLKDVPVAEAELNPLFVQSLVCKPMS
jgi:hypothetical protein